MPDAFAYSKFKDFCVNALTNLVNTRQDVFGPETPTVYRQMQEDLTNVSYPCLTVVAVRLHPEMIGGDTEVVYWRLPFNIFIRDREAGSLHIDEGKYMGWHQAIMDYFRDALLDTKGLNTNVHQPYTQAQVVPRPIFEEERKYEDVAGGMGLNFWIIEQRTT